MSERFFLESSECPQMGTQGGSPSKGIGERDHKALASASPEFLLAQKNDQLPQQSES